MQEDRDILVKKVFPQLRKMCEERAVIWTEVDLRWGITDEQKSEGKVLPLCLEEIRRCRPYFIGLLGERYGWIPDPHSIPSDLLEMQPWLRKHIYDRTSVTELEILHGVFGEEPMHGHAYFYLRNSNYSETQPDEKRKELAAESDEALRKLEKLKDKIRAARDERICELRENYTTPEQLGEWVLEDFTQLIETIYPKSQTPEALDLEAVRHEAYALNRRLAFVSRENLLHHLCQYLSEGGKPIVLTGESGCGKSALLAECVARWRKDHPDDLIIQHFIGSTPDSADWQGLVRHLLAAMKHAFSIADEVPLQRDTLHGALSEWTSKVSGSRRILIVLDAINQLADDGAARQLTWLPADFPKNFRVLVSSLPGVSLDVLLKRGCLELNVPQFTREDIAAAALAYFKVFSKTPPPDIVAKLESTPAACNPLYLRAVLDELRQFGINEKLQAKAAEYLAAPNLPELYDRILARWEQDFGKDPEHPDIVRRSLALVACSRSGLSEAELLDLLGREYEYIPGQVRIVDFTSFMPLGSSTDVKEYKPLPRAKWSPFYLAAEHAITIHAGLLNFGHEYLRSAVQKRFLCHKEIEKFNHDTIARYFWGRDVSRRTVDELPWQFLRLKEWTDLIATLVSSNLFQEACIVGKQFEWMQYWQEIRQLAAIDSFLGLQGLSIDIPELYSQGFARLTDEERLKLSGSLADFLRELGFPEAAKKYLDAEARLIKEYKTTESNIDACLLGANLNSQGLVLMDKDDAAGAIRIFDQAEQVLLAKSSDPESRRALASVLMNKANALRRTGDVPRAMELLGSAVISMREAYGKESAEVATVLQAFGNACFDAKDFNSALSWQHQAYHIRHDKLGDDHRDTALSLGNIANTLFCMQQFCRGEPLLRKSAEVLVKILGSEHAFSKSVTTTLQEYELRAQQVIQDHSPFGAILLVLESLPSSESPPIPTSPEGKRIVANTISENLIAIWDDSIANGSSIPVTIISCPEYEETVALAINTPIARRFTDKLLQWVKIPKIVNSVESDRSVPPPEVLLPLLEVRNLLLNWVNVNELQIIMVKPFANTGSPFKRMIPRWILHKQGTPETPLNAHESRGDQTTEGSIHPLIIEVVPHDGCDGPLTGLYTGDAKPRACIIPTADWKAQGYKPQSGDSRAIGTFYLNLPAIRSSFDASMSDGITALDRWSIEQLLSLATSDRIEQCEVFEKALSALMLVLQTEQISCPPERGGRGFHVDDSPEWDDLFWT